MDVSSVATRKNRVRRNPDETRQLILDTAEQLMVEESYAAVTTRCIARRASLTSGLIHYYYPTTDEMFKALYGRMAQRYEEGLRQVLDAPDPVTAVWAFQTNWSHSPLSTEFLALSNHRKDICEEIAQRTVKHREMLADGLARAMADGRMAASIYNQMCDPMCLATLMTAMSRFLVSERVLGISSGHAQLQALMERLLLLGGVPKSCSGSDCNFDSS